MKLFIVYFLIFVTVTTATDGKYSSADSFLGAEEASYLNPLNNYGGWINLEDLPPMPQCIAQQNHSLWLDALTNCTWKRCSRHFGVICTQHQWQTEPSCLSTSISSDVVREYLPICDRSVLAKAQLSFWIRGVIGRPWLVEVGDTNDLRNLSPSSLRKGFSTIDVIGKAPTCLEESLSALSTEAFQHAIASCSFTNVARSTGNAARPWEYNERLNSVVALDSETASYDLTLHSIEYGEYFDRNCFCDAFTVDLESDTCSDTEWVDLTQERLWIHATCGPQAFPWNWTHSLKTTDYAYISTTDWYWPKCIADVPNKIVDLTAQCAKDACGFDSDGYCEVTPAIDRTCFCRSISYDSCGGTCHIFETRIDYINWLRHVCGAVQDWHGLPDNWRQLSAPAYLDVIPWQWAMKPSISLNTSFTCTSVGDQLGSLAFLNAAPFLVALFREKAKMRAILRRLPWHANQYNWLITGFFLSALQLLLMWCNASLVQSTPHYDGVPVAQLVLLWCTIPRIAWLPMLLAKDLYATLSLLVAESVLQTLSLSYMLSTVHYGLSHNFFFRDLENAQNASSARMMYFSAAAWLFVFVAALVQIVRILSAEDDTAGREHFDPSELHNNPANSLPKGLKTAFYKYFAESLKAEARKGPLTERTALWHHGSTSNTSYNTLPYHYSKIKWPFSKVFPELHVIVASSMVMLWGAQWLFWIGFTNLSSGEYCPPHLGAFTVVSIAATVICVVAAATR